MKCPHCSMGCMLSSGPLVKAGVTVGWGHCGSVTSCHKVGAAEGHGGVQAWRFRHLEGPGDDLLL